jgi:hypothetical protein
MDINSRRDDDWLNSIPLRLRPKIVHTRVTTIYTYLKLGGVSPVLNDIEKTWLCILIIIIIIIIITTPPNRPSDFAD